MEIIKGMEIIDLALYLKEYQTLIIADSHIGFEEALNKQGLMVPRFQFKEVVDRINKIINKINEIKINNNKDKNINNINNKNKIINKNNNKINDKNNIINNKTNKKINKNNNKINTIIINGDIKHEFGKISEQEWREALKIIDLLQKNCDKLILIKGNHDTILGPIAHKKGIEIVTHYKINDIYICHGHKIPMDADFAKSKTIIIGHEHPAVSLKQGSRSELFKCFLKGKYERKNLIVMPSLNLVTEGTDILRESLLSPFLQKDLKNFEAYLIADEVYYFGKLGGLET